MSLLDLASLVLAPTATKEGKVYSAIPDTGEGDMTFTRGSAATRVNSAGLIEKERGNLLLQSNSFNTTWQTQNASVTSGQVGYDGSSDAWLLTDDAVNGSHDVRQSISIGGLKTISVYAKAGTLNFLKVYSGASLTYFNLSTGEVGTNGHSGAYMEDVGGGWYRCSLFDTATFTFALFGVTNANNVASYSGTGSGSIYIQDAMLNQGLVAQSYIETTTSAVYEGITDDVPRVDYSGGGCPSLLLEPQRTNLVTFSEQFDNASWTKYLSTITANATTAPDGTASADLILDNATNDAHAAFKTVSASAGVYTWSVFAKAQNLNFLIISAYTGSHNRTWFNLSNGTIGTNAAGNTATITSYGNGWYMCSVSRTYVSGSLVYEVSTATSNGVSSYIGSGNGIFIWGAQLEAGSYSTSYIPTYSVSSTRVADSCSKTGISELIGQTEGTMFAEFIMPPTGTLFTHYRISGVGGLYNDSQNITLTATNEIRGWSFSGTSEQAQINSGVYAEGTKVKVAYAFKTNDFILYVNGTQIGTDTSGSVPAMSEFLVGSYYPNTSLNVVNETNQAILFPTRLTNDQLEELTK